MESVGQQPPGHSSVQRQSSLVQWSNGPMTVPDSIQCTLASYCPAAEISSSLHIVRVDRRRRSESGLRDRHHPIWCSPLISTDIKTGRDSDWPKLVAMGVKRGKMLFLFSIQQRSIDRSAVVIGFCFPDQRRRQRRRGVCPSEWTGLTRKRLQIVSRCQ